jgi:hypothetical protein
MSRKFYVPSSLLSCGGVLFSLQEQRPELEGNYSALSTGYVELHALTYDHIFAAVLVYAQGRV